jgi:hypothetical protein
VKAFIAAVVTASGIAFLLDFLFRTASLAELIFGVPMLVVGAVYLIKEKI